MTYSIFIEFNFIEHNIRRRNSIWRPHIMEGNKIFAERVKAEKEKHNLTTTQLAEKLGINKSRISMWETNGTIPRQDMLLKLCTLFNVSSDYLLGNEVDMKSEQISSIQRKLSKLNPTALEKANNILDAAFAEIFGVIK